MGVYINMDMSKKKNGAVVVIYPDGKVYYEDGEEYKAIPVPPHGRLIDADAFKQQLIDECRKAQQYFATKLFRERSQQLVSAIISELDDQPTIIPAKEGEA